MLDETPEDQSTFSPSGPAGLFWVDKHPYSIWWTSEKVHVSEFACHWKNYEQTLETKPLLPKRVHSAKALFTLYLLTLWNTALGRPREFFTPRLPCCTFTLCPYSMGFRLHVSRIPQGFTAYPYSGAGVAIPRGMPICRGRSGVKRFKCERTGRYSPGVSPLQTRVVWKGL